MIKALILLMAGNLTWADSPGRIESKFSKTEFPLTANPSAPQWKAAKPVVADRDRQGNPVKGHSTQVYSRWTKDNLYLLFACPYESLYPKPDPSTTTETNKLWEWDVAEVFVGADFENINHYREFQVSPQGEWVDLDIHRGKPNMAAEGWKWNSGFKTMARIDSAKKIWYGEMKIPLSSLDSKPVKPGAEMRINFYRIQGPPPDRIFINWQPVMNQSYHTPEKFGRILLAK